MISQHENQELLHGDVANIVFDLVHSLLVTTHPEPINYILSRSLLRLIFRLTQEFEEYHSQRPNVSLDTDVFLVDEYSLRCIVRQRLLNHVSPAIRRNGLEMAFGRAVTAHNGLS